MANELKLIGSALSPYALRVLLAARHKGIELTVDPPDGGTRGAEHLRRNPVGKIPVLIDGTLVLPESDVIVSYLEDRFPTPTLLPGDAVQRATARLLPRLIDTYGPGSFGAFLQDDRPGIAVALQRITDCLRYIDHFRPDAEFAAGAAFSTADCALIPFFCIFERLQSGFQTLDLVRAHPRLDAWWARARASDAGTFAGSALDAALRQLSPDPSL